jgi:hypothetical protein
VTPKSYAWGSFLLIGGAPATAHALFDHHRFPETLCLLAAIGIEKGKPFAPDARMQKILTEAAAVGNATPSP